MLQTALIAATGSACSSCLVAPPAPCEVGDLYCSSAQTLLLSLLSNSDNLAFPAVSAGGAFTCALLVDGQVRCWGNGGGGRLGYGNTQTIGDDETPASAGSVPLGGKATQIDVGVDHACAVLESGGVRCWGVGGNGRLGYGNTTNVGDNETPASVGDVPLGGTAVQVSAGQWHTCALMTTGKVRCWGAGNFGQTGYSTTVDIGDDEFPSSMGDVDVGGIATQVSAAGQHTCALLTDGSLRCWGRATYGQLGTGNTTTIGDNELPSSVGPVSVNGTVVQVETAGYSDISHTCALLADGTVRCWGTTADGQIGSGNTTTIGDTELPTAVGALDIPGRVVQIDSMKNHNCARLDTGEIYCWGAGGNGRLGYANTISIGDDETPVSAGSVPLGAGTQDITVGNGHSCVVFDDERIRCWGNAANGRLGTLDTTNTIGDDEYPQAGTDAIVRDEDA